MGGTVGGILGLALLGILVFFVLRRQRQKRIEKEFDGNFDPAATDKRSSTFNSIRGPAGDGGTLPNLGTDNELLDDGMGGRLAGTVVGGGIVSPFILPSSRSASGTSMDDPRRISDERMLYDRGAISPQTTGSSLNPYVPSAVMGPQVHRRTISGNSSQSPYPPTSFSYPTVNVYESRPRSTTPSTGSEYSQSSSAKEREAHSGFMIANPDTNTSNASSVTREQRENYLRSGPSPRSATFPQHQVPNRDDELTEIPPTYDSLLN